MTLLPPTLSQLRRMQDELYQDPNRTEEQVNNISSWLALQPHLPHNIEHTWIERFLYGCKYDEERTKQVLEKYYTVRLTIPEFFSNRDPCQPGLVQSYDTVFIFTLPELTDEGYRVSICGLLDSDINKWSVRDFTVRSLMNFDVRLLEESCLGDVYIMDLSGFTFKHLSHYTIGFIKKCVLCQIDAMPLRVKGIHFLYSPSFFGAFLSIFKFFIKKKLKDRIHVHYDDITTLHKYIPQKILPHEYGGEAGTTVQLNNAWRDKLIRYRDWFISN